MEHDIYKFSYIKSNGEKTKVKYICASDISIDDLVDMCMSFAKALGYTPETIEEHFKTY